MTSRHVHIGFVSTRFAGTDGVSLETAKWAAVLEAMGHVCFYFAGELDRPSERSQLVPEAHFVHPEVQRVGDALFGTSVRSAETARKVERLKDHLKEKLQQFIANFDLQLLIIQNAVSLPMNLPLGLALTELLAETGLPAIAHHHDFIWERKRFLHNAAGDYVQSAFPPSLPSIQHVVINSLAQRQLGLRLGRSSTLVPNVMDFATPPPPPDGFADDLRAELGIPPGQPLILQPTRVVPRKRIETAIGLASRLSEDSVLVISHASGDEGDAYLRYLEASAELMGIRMIYMAERVDHMRGQSPQGQKIYSLADLYQQADLVVYPSAIEGFGNAFIETMYYQRPLILQRYDVYQADIEPKGFRVVGFDEFFTEETIADAQELLRHPERARVDLEHNSQLGRMHYSYEVLERKLARLLDDSFDGGAVG